MYQVSCDTTHLVKRLDKMIRRLRHVKRVEVGTVLSDWQTEDMHRHRPGTKRNRSQGIARTIVRPHSRFEMARSRRHSSRAIRRAKRMHTMAANIHRSTRPILRQVMLDDLKRRVHELAASIHW